MSDLRASAEWVLKRLLDDNVIEKLSNGLGEMADDFQNMPAFVGQAERDPAGFNAMVSGVEKTRQDLAELWEALEAVRSGEPLDAVQATALGQMGERLLYAFATCENALNISAYSKNTQEILHAIDDSSGILPTVLGASVKDYLEMNRDQISQSSLGMVVTLAQMNVDNRQPQFAAAAVAGNRTLVGRY